ncbi:MAG: cysteine desulfurase [Bacteroidales bacterium]|nr:cysteine desulfurase [Bacteroidales bacterium]
MKTSVRLVYADHAATTPLSPEALKTMLPWLEGGGGNPSSLHSFGREARKAIEGARATVAECLGAEPGEIFFTGGGTEANNWVVKGTGGGLLVSAYEHHSVLTAAESERQRGRPVALVAPKMVGVILSEKLRKAWLEGTGLVSVMAANNEIGTLNPIDELCYETHKRGALFHTDAVQAVGKIELDVHESDFDYLSASAHKFGGPQGVGFLYAKGGKAPARLLDGGAQERGTRAGTENVAGIVGMAAALRTTCGRMEETADWLLGLKLMLQRGLKRLFPKCVFHGAEFGYQIPGFVSVSIPGHPAEGMLHIFDMKGIALSAGAACNSRQTEISHVLKAISVPRRLAECTLRISLGHGNTEEDIQRILDAFRIVAKTARAHK